METINLENEILENEILEIIPKVELSNYQKRKASIYKWRAANYDKFLRTQSEWFNNKMNNPEQKQKNLDRVKANYHKKQAIKREAGLLKPLGRPRKYV
jgi:hypothetical protein